MKRKIIITDKNNIEVIGDLDIRASDAIIILDNENVSDIINQDVDATLDATSTNPIQNKAVANALGDVNSVLEAINGD